jgi:signal peptidase I
MSETAAAADKKSGAIHETVEVIKTVLVALAIALVLRVIFFQPFTIPSASMEPNLYEGDYIVVSKYAYGWSKHSIPFSPPLFEGRLLERAPKRGDIAVFKLPRDTKIDYIKRVVGLPGDRVQVKGGVVYINGERVPRAEMGRVDEQVGYGSHEVTRYQETLPGGKTILVNDYGSDGDLDDTSVMVVPAGHYFMMGDNRDNSMDSRLPASVGVGYVPAEMLVGKAEIILVSWKKGASLFKPWTWVLNLQPSRFFRVLH